MPSSRGKRPVPPRRRLKCSYHESGRRCPRDGHGNPPLCQAHTIAVMEASRPKRPTEVLADAFVNFLQGKPINTEATIGAVDSLIGQWSSGMGSDFRPDVAGGDARAGQRPWWWTVIGQGGPAGQGAPPPPADARAQAEAKRVELEARRVMGFAAGQPLTEPLINARRKVLARRNHPDLGGSTEKMTIINAAADMLLSTLATP